jgi:thiamine biosynthesis protein ThiI
MIRLTGEISTKGRRTRSRFQRVLADNLEDACHSMGRECRISDRWSRLYVDCDGPLDEVLSRVFGVSSFSRIDGWCAANLDEIVRRGAELYGEIVKGRRYAVRARRSGSHAFSSQDVMTDLGASLNPGARVDLSDPELEVCVEIRDDRALFHLGKTAGAGGLPLGAEGRAVALLSGGFDSAVAAWMMLKRGVALDYVFCNLGGEAYKRMVVEVAKILADRWSYGTRPTLHVVDFDEVVADLKSAVRPAFHQIALKRQMYRVANLVAATLGADAVVTGEAVGQVSSQTLANLRVIDDSSELPVLRPVVGMDKEEIIRRSREIGSYALSSRVREYCALGSGRPATAASPDAVRRDDSRLDLSGLHRPVQGREILDLRAVDLAEIAGQSVFTSILPPGAVVIDTRDIGDYRRWHWPGASHRDHGDLVSEFRTLDRGNCYVLYCSQGLKSARLAERMQAAGYEAYSFLGGETRLRRLAGSLGEAGQGGAQ